MSHAEAKQLRTTLSVSGVNLEVIPRGFNQQRGVPDSVIWISPDTLPASSQYPILVELEGRLSNVDDFRKFARRRTVEEPYRHHLEFSTLKRIDSGFSLPVTYDVAAVADRILSPHETGGIDEPTFHSAIREWTKTKLPAFRTNARITILGQTRIVWWQLEFPMFGHQFDIEIPFIVDVGPEFQRRFELYSNRISIPSIAVLTDESSSKRYNKTHATDIQFRYLINPVN